MFGSIHRPYLTLRASFTAPNRPTCAGAKGFQEDEEFRAHDSGGRNLLLWTRPAARVLHEGIVDVTAVQGRVQSQWLLLQLLQRVFHSEELETVEQCGGKRGVEEEFAAPLYPASLASRIASVVVNVVMTVLNTCACSAPL